MKNVQTYKVSKTQMNEIFVADGFRWSFESAMTKLGAQTYARESPFVHALEFWVNTQEDAPKPASKPSKPAPDYCPRCSYQRCPDGCCCGC